MKIPKKILLGGRVWSILINWISKQIMIDIAKKVSMKKKISNTMC